MGYRTYHTISCQTEDQEHEIEASMLAFLITLTGYGENHFNGFEWAKWYDCDVDMMDLSMEYPLTTFRVDGDGETPGDVWVKWFRAGALISHWWAPEIITPSGFTPPEPPPVLDKCWVGVDQAGARWYFDTQVERDRTAELWQRTYSMTEDFL